MTSNFELDVIPMSDVDRSKRFYSKLGWRFDADDSPTGGLCIVQFTPPVSGCSVSFAEGISTAVPGSAEATLTVPDIVAAHDELVGRGIETTDVRHGPPLPAQARIPGPDPEHTSYASFCSVSYQDGNAWIVQEVTTRLAGSI